jgi:uncharacterized protein (TIGR02001 family)
MKLKSLAIASFAAFNVLGAQAADVSYNIGAVTLYKSNGVDQDYDKASATGQPFNKSIRAAIQGGVDVDLGNGFYVGNWNSTGHFEDANLEMDFYAGYAGEFGGGVSYDVSYAYYLYPSQSSWNGGEVVGSLSYGGFKFKLSNGLSGSIQDSDNKSKRRAAISYTADLSDLVSATITYGMRNKAGGDFSDYAVAVSYQLAGDVTLTGTYSGADKKDEADNHERDDRFVLGVSKSF